MPSYEASHEYDKRGHRNHQPPMPAIPVMPPHAGNQQRHPPPQGNPQQFNRGGPAPPRNGPPPQNYAIDAHKRGGMGPSQPPYPYPQGGPIPPYALPNGGAFPPHPPPNGYRNGPPPPPGSYGPGYGGPGPLPPPGQFMPHPSRPPYGVGPSGGNRGMPPRNSDRRDMPRNDRNDRRDMPRNNAPGPPPMRLPLNCNLPPRPIAPLGSVPPPDNDRYRGGGYNDRRSEPHPSDDVPDGPPSGALNYG